MRRLLLAVALFVAVVGSASAATTPTEPVFNRQGRIIQTPLAPPNQPAVLTDDRAIAIFRADPKVKAWLARYPTGGRTADAQFHEDFRYWQVNLWWGKAGEIATGRVDDATSKVTEAWTGPQVAWKMARGYDGAFGGKKINTYPVWLGFCAIFLLGLIDWRRPLSLRNLDLVALLSFSVSLWFFNRGNIFASAPLAYPPMLYLIGRGLWIGLTGRPSRGRTVWPVWVLLAATAFIAGFRVTEFNVRNSNVIDVGYSGVIGAERIVHGEWPYGHMPDEGTLKACGPADQDGEIRERIQTNGRCESANPRGDTYGPVAYESYIPGYLAFGWSGKWDDLPAAHATVIAFDLLCILGLALVGLRFGGPAFAATLAFAWTAFPFTQYASSSNTNDALLPAFLIWGFWLLTSPWARGAFVALAGWTKFAAFVVAPMWVTYRLTRRQIVRAASGFALATLAAFSIVLLEPNVGHALRVFWDRTLSWQLSRESPFSIWDWRQYHARGIPNLEIVQRFLQALLVAGALAFALVPRKKTPLQLAALTGVLLLGFEMVLTHWSYLYIPWFFPFVAYAVLAEAAPEPPEPEPDEQQPVPELVAAG
ncbi:MAG TPA: hypothetical protein VF232_01175 [Gaiellaceae bacterium]